MKFKGITQSDFDIFTIPGLEARMKALISQLRPKLELIGQELSPSLSAKLGEEFFPHVAKHARRSVNPPDDTWVAWANDKRGYKKHPHFQVGLWSTHLFIWFAIIYESTSKVSYANQMIKHLDQIYAKIPPHYEWSWDHTDPSRVRHSDLTVEKLEHYLKRVSNVKKAELLCGVTIERNDPILTDGKALLERIEDTFTTLAPLYKIGKVE